MHNEEGHCHLTELPGADFEIPADLVQLAIGYADLAPGDVVAELGLRLTARGALATDPDKMTSCPGVFAGGQALIANAISWAGRRRIDRQQQLAEMALTDPVT